MGMMFSDIGINAEPTEGNGRGQAGGARVPLAALMLIYLFAGIFFLRKVWVK